MLDSLSLSTRFDLHLHSLRSDGRYPPEEVLLRCARAGLDVIALTDHDLPTSLPLGPQIIEGRTITVLAGAEVSGVHRGHEYHLLVYFPGEVPQGFRDFCAEQCKARARRYEQARHNLERSNLERTGIEPAGTAAVQGEIALTRHHLARQLVDRGHVRNLREAFALYLSESRGLVPSIELTFCEAVRIARSYGGITSWAHPPATLLQDCLPAFVAAGLQGIEGLRPQVSSADRRKYRNAARRFGLMLTGGSDWHGWGDDGDLGLFRVEAREIPEFIERLRAAQVAAAHPRG